ncbi:DUF5011 domain-containing protein [Sabulilitoribacter multivorans]|uniref:DUF5011 domain-containing protein n=1 Tax=Flaviramulus multivorans TaxID=1304750 RepID=A0ABS9IM15_9FLAO|nr:immunoglobulin-like domain-containing protein [Flaviramulus multivorans]MCF7561630.1 DUF5011 domain-containing protein [Flaviramulus multivorans]
MKKLLPVLLILLNVTFVFSQSNSFWKKETTAKNAKIKASKTDIKNPNIYTLNIEGLKQELQKAPKRNLSNKSESGIIISFPNSLGKIESFRVKEASVMHPDLQARFPNIRSYVGQGVSDPSEVIRFSVSPLGLHSMTISPNKRATFIEPYTEDLGYYRVYDRSQRINTDDDFECEVTYQVNKKLNADKSSASTMKNADDAILRTYRLAVSATGEYTQYHGGTKALALAAINTTMTRVNGIYESDFNVNLVLIANTDDVIYTSTSSDPYGNTTSGYNSALQSTLTSVIGEANYDIGHLFANLQNNGNAGCIGCVCVNNQKGSGWTSHTVPEGDPFDVDYVAHEMGHQFGGNHTWTFGGNEGSGVQVEPGSGSTIMGYAGITGATDVQSNSDPYFHAVSIEQITDYIKTTSCQTNTATGNAVPTADAGSNYTIPRGTPFVLTGTGTDANSGDVLTYCWEQINNGSSSTTNPNPNATSGPAFRSYNPTTNNQRYFPRLETVKTGATSWQWEAVPNVARTMNFRLTVRDNVAGGGNNNSDDMIVTVNSSAGPFVVSAPNTNVTWNAGTTQTVTWDVAGTTGNGVNAANVDIFLSTDGGDTYPIALAAGVPNDGSHDIVVPNNQGTQNRIMVKGSNHIFFDISNANFTIAGQVVCNATTPTGLNASSINSDSATLSWDVVPGASYDLEYRQVGAGSWTTVSVSGVSQALSGLSPLTQYEAQVRSKCPDTSTSAYSSIINFTTTDVQLNYCSSASTNVNDEYISRVQLNTIDNASGAQFYSDFTGISTTLDKDTQYTITVTPTWTGSTYQEAYSVWIDYNRDGDFDDAGEQVWTQAATTASPVSGNFTVPSSAVENTTTMRVSMKYNGIPTACETFTYGEVEDYSITIQGSGPDITAPVITLNGAASIDLNVGDTYNELGATATDDVDGDISANIVVGGDTVDTNTAGTYVVTYNVSDAAGNPATEVIRTVNVIPDTTAPVISLNGASTINISIGGVYTEEGATATDNIDGDISANIVIGGDTVDTNTPGTYLVTYNVSDAAGNPATEVVRTVNVTPDTTAPVITLNGASTINVNLGDAYTELGATATDDLDGDISANIIIGGDAVNTNTAGTYFVTYNVSDAAGNPATEVVRTVNVIPDTTAPVITLTGASVIDLTTGDTYTELGATATDDFDGDISANIVIGGDTVDTNIAGTYIVTYNVSDAAGNPAAEVTRTINVTEPSIGCTGGISSFPYTESFENTLGAWTQSTADDIDWTVDSAGTPSSNTGPSSGSVGSYYIYVEASGNGTGYPNKRAIINSPCFDLSGLTTANFTFDYHMFGAADMGTIDLEISDDDGASWVSIWNQSGNQGNAWLNVNINLSAYVGGGVQLRFNRFVGSTWQADIAIDNVNLTGFGGPDTTAPVITLNGASTINLEQGDSYTEQGATATDNVDGDISANIVIGGDTVNTSTVGTYVITYNVSDAAGNAATQVTRTVNVALDSTAPVISLIGASSISLDLGDTYNEQGATATDNFDGDISVNIVIGGDTVNTNVEGTYVVTYNVTDAAGNAATQQTRTVTVTDPTSGPVVLNEGYFETGWDSWTDGGSDCARVSSSNSYEGSYSIRIRDNSGVASSMTLSNIDVTPYSEVVIDFYFYVFSMENGEDFWVRFFNGSTWSTVATYVSGSGINNNTFYNASVSLTPAQYNFAANAGFRFQCDASGNNDQIFIDQVTITGNSGAARGNNDKLIALGTYERPGTSDLFEDDFRVYPNPVKGDILNVTILGVEKFSYRIMNMIGQTITKGNSDGEVGVSNLEAGMYFIEVNDGEEVMTKKFIKE